MLSVWHFERHRPTSSLPSGKALAAAGSAGGTFLNSAELYDPTTETWSPTGNLTFPRAEQAATEFSNGKVVVAGGSPAYTSVEMYSPATGRWTSGGSMVKEHSCCHTATRLKDGRMLVVGGEASSYNTQKSDELGTNMR